MHDVLVFTARLLLVIFVGMNLLILARKARRARGEAIEKSRSVAWEDRILAFVHSEEPSFLHSLGSRPSRGDQRVLEKLLLEYARRVDGTARRRLGGALEELGWVGRTLESLRHRSEWRRAEAAEKLGLAGVDRARDALRRSLGDASAEVRFRAAKALAQLGEMNAVGPHLEALSRPDRWSALRVADILARGGDRVVDELIAAFPRLNPRAKLAALDALASAHAVRACEWLRGRLEDPEPEVRARACRALGVIGDPEAGGGVTSRLRDPSWPVRAAAVRALGELGHEAAVPALCNALTDREWWVRANAGRALRRFGRKGVAALQLMIDDEDRYAAQQAVATLEECGIIDEEIRALALPPGRARKRASSFLWLLIRSGRTSRVEECASRHPDRRVRDALENLLAAGGGRS